uniref:16S rRNA (uracil(1498)-N(3))-methyltransferase n=1 Tax=Paulinella longichromatophora TaxID=1708747 RepID=A0A2H4ZQ90_9EUKA|nr:hypothetical protein PLO_701 [Paulinella longichromatophora]
MTRELRRLLISPLRLNTNNKLKLSLSEAHYLTRVLRYQIGQYFVLVDGVGRLWSATLISTTHAHIKESLNQPFLQGIPPSPQIKLALALPRKGFDNVLRTASELGVDRIQPLITERCIYKKQQGFDRWNTILEEATEQCERLWIPLCGHPCDAQLWFHTQAQNTYSTTYKKDIIKIFATTRRKSLVSITNLLNDIACQQLLPHQICLAIGPEGGWTPEEEQIAEQTGWQPVTLGPQILQTPTAAIAGITLIANWRVMKNGF